MFPYARGRDGELKRQLVRAAIAGIEAVWSVDPGARMMFPEPLIHNVPPRWRPWHTEPAAHSARQPIRSVGHDRRPRRAGAGRGRALPRHRGRRTITPPISGRFRAAASCIGMPDRTTRAGGRLHLLLQEVYERYRRPMIIAETSHYGVGRAAWLNEDRARVPHRHRSRRAACMASACIRSSTASTGRTAATGTTAACGTCTRTARATTSAC